MIVYSSDSIMWEQTDWNSGVWTEWFSEWIGVQKRVLQVFFIEQYFSSAELGSEHIDRNGQRGGQSVSGEYSTRTSSWSNTLPLFFRYSWLFPITTSVNRSLRNGCLYLRRRMTSFPNRTKEHLVSIFRTLTSWITPLPIYLNTLNRISNSINQMLNKYCWIRTMETAVIRWW